MFPRYSLKRVGRFITRSQNTVDTTVLIDAKRDISLLTEMHLPPEVRVKVIGMVDEDSHVAPVYTASRLKINSRLQFPK